MYRANYRSLRRHRIYIISSTVIIILLIVIRNSFTTIDSFYNKHLTDSNALPQIDILNEDDEGDDSIEGYPEQSNFLKEENLLNKILDIKPVESNDIEKQVYKQLLVNTKLNKQQQQQSRKGIMEKKLEQNQDEQQNEKQKRILTANNQTESYASNDIDDGGGILAKIKSSIDPGMPSAYLVYHTPSTDEPYCKYNNHLPYEFAMENEQFPPGEGSTSPYIVFYDIIESHDIDNVSQITFVTHLSADFVYYIPELLRRWTGLISVAVFAPRSDLVFFLEQINKYCFCEPEMYRVSIHLVVLTELPVSFTFLEHPKPDRCIPEDSSKFNIFINRKNEQIAYPFNVLRNVARFGSSTRYILVSDIDLMPSENLANQFLNFIGSYEKIQSREVFVLPVFQVSSAPEIPSNKSHLIKLIKKKKADYLRKTFCSQCHWFLNLDKWIRSRSSDKIKAFNTVKREFPYHKWEPVFIGTNLEPLYPEKISWSKFRDKAQVLEMCLQNYDFTILDNAFLIRWPQNKKTDSQRESKNFLIAPNTDVYLDILRTYRRRYTNYVQCTLCVDIL